MISRRHGLFALLMIPLVLFVRFVFPSRSDANGTFVPFAEIPQNGVYMLRDKKVAIINQHGKISAISISCTHLGCTLNVANDIFVCPCHGSEFTLTGRLLKGPATVDLKAIKYKITETGVEL